MIIFESIKLVPAESKHLPYLVRWLNNLPPTRINITKRPTCIFEQEERLENLTSQNQLFIAHNEVEPFGFVELTHRPSPARITDMRTFAERDGEQKIIIAAAQYCFNELGRNKIVAELLAGDASLVKIYEGIGFKPEIRRRQHYYSDGRFHHVVENALLLKEFKHG